MSSTPTDDDVPPRIGVIGAGRMGSAILQRLTAGPWQVGVHDRDDARATAARARGQQWFPDAGDLVAWADIVVTVLPDGSVLREVMTDATCAACGPGAVWVDFTSGDPVTTREATELGAAHGLPLVAAPMGGGPVEAADGALLFFVAGPDDAVDRVRPVLEHLAAPGRVRSVGQEPADAQTVKLLVNALWFTQALATSEALLVAARAGIGPERMRDLLPGTAGASAFSDRFLSRFLDGDDFSSFGVDGVVTELRGVRRAAGSLLTPVLDASLTQHEAALARFGTAGGEIAAVQLLEEQNGIALRPLTAGERRT